MNNLGKCKRCGSSGVFLNISNREGDFQLDLYGKILNSENPKFIDGTTIPEIYPNGENHMSTDFICEDCEDECDAEVTIKGFITNNADEALNKFTSEYVDGAAAEEKIRKDLTEALLVYIKNNPGVLQKDLHKIFSKNERDDIGLLVYNLAKEEKIFRQKEGSTYILSNTKF